MIVPYTRATLDALTFGATGLVGWRRWRGARESSSVLSRAAASALASIVRPGRERVRKMWRTVMRTPALRAGRRTRRCRSAVHARTALVEWMMAGATSTGTDWSGRVEP